MLEDVFGLSIAYVTYCNIKERQCRKVIDKIAAPNGNTFELKMTGAI